MPAYYNEHDAFAADWLRELIREGLIAPGDVDERDIQDVQPGDLAGYQQCHFFAGIGGWSLALRLAGWPDARPVWTGSCPCQPFSSAGKGQGFDDPRHLWPTWFRLIRECRPPVVFGEQVASANGRAWLDHVATNMEALDYAFGAADLPAACVNASHIRPRLWFVAHPNSDGLKGPTSGPTAPHALWYVGVHWEVRQEVRGTAWSGVQPPFPPGPGCIGDIPALDDGIPSYLGEQCAGNAIVPQVAAEFIAAWCEVKATA